MFRKSTTDSETLFIMLEYEVTQLSDSTNAKTTKKHPRPASLIAFKTSLIFVAIVISFYTNFKERFYWF